MAIDDRLQRFVRNALGRGVPRADVESVLTRAGWESSQVKGALASFADVEFPIPVPRPQRYLNARDTFLYLLVFATLYAVAISFGSAVFELINRAFPDPAVRDATVAMAQSIASLRWSISWLIVATPVFVYVSSLTRRELRRDPVKQGSKIRRWLTYLTLFVASMVLIGDFTTLIYSVLSGELTIRFVLKTLTVGGIAAGVFGYYLWDLKGDDTGAAG